MVGPEAGDDAVLYAYSRDAARVLNHMARSRAEAEGRLSGAELKLGERPRADLAERTYRVGDELCLLRNRARLGKARDASGLGVRNGTRGVVVEVDLSSQELTLEARDGRLIILPADYVERFTDYGYAWTLHKAQGQTVGQVARGLGEDDLRRRGRAFVFGAESLTAEAALVAASRATDSTELFVLVDPDEMPESRAAEAARIGRAWAHGEHEQLGLGDLEAAREIARLATTSRSDLANERDALAALIGRGPTADLRWQADDTRRRLGSALVQLDEAIDKEQALRHEISHAEQDERPEAERRLRDHIRVRAATERDASHTFADMTAVESAIVEQLRLRRERRSDLRSALDRLELVDSALSLERQHRIARTSSAPPDYIVALLGDQPQGDARFLRWQQGLVEIEDWRTAAAVSSTGDDPSPWVRALGPPLDGWNGRRRQRLVESLRTVRRDLGLEDEHATRVTAGSGTISWDRATEAVLARRSSSRTLPPKTVQPPRRSAHRLRER